MNGILGTIDKAYNTFEHFWESVRVQRAVSALIVMVFLLGLLGIELNRLGFLPEPLASLTPRSHYYAINIALTLLLVFEVMALILALAKSISKSVGKQFEILSLILIRQSFEELVHFSEPIDPTHHLPTVLSILTNGVAALAIFIALGFYYRLQLHRPIDITPADRASFIARKKAIALLLLALFTVLGVRSTWNFILNHDGIGFFETFYTVLVFSDILIILVSLRYLPTYHAIFRNSGFALSTLLIRIALTAPPFANAAIGTAAALFAVGLSVAFNAFTRPTLCRDMADKEKCRNDG